MGAAPPQIPRSSSPDISSTELEPDGTPGPDEGEASAPEAGPVLVTESPWGRRWQAGVRMVGRITEWVLGLAALGVGLAVLSIVPVLNLLSLGYLLECAVRVSRSGRWRDGFIGVRRAAVLGRLIAGGWLVMLPASFLAGFWRDAELIAPGSAKAQGFFVGLILLANLTVVHLVWAVLRGGKLRHFFWPAPVALVRWLRQPDKFAVFQRDILEPLSGWPLGRLFLLGAKGFAGALAWLILPVGLLILAAELPPGPGFLVSVLGAIPLGIVVCSLPFLQCHQARENRFQAIFEWRSIRDACRRAPIAFWVALAVTLLLALPLYLLKIELTPRDLAWLPALLFVVFIFPARILTGWALYRAEKREQPRHWTFRWMGRLAAFPVALIYVVFVYITQYLGWYGSLGLLEQHAFLVPAPLMSL